MEHRKRILFCSRQEKRGIRSGSASDAFRSSFMDDEVESKMSISVSCSRDYLDTWTGVGLRILARSSGEISTSRPFLPAFIHIFGRSRIDTST